MLAIAPWAAAVEKPGAELEKQFQSARQLAQQGKHAEARAAFDKVIEQCKGELADSAFAGYAHLAQANTLHHLGDIRAARQHLGEAVGVFKKIDDSQGRAECLMLAGTIDLQQSRFEEAIAAFDATLALREARGDMVGMAAAAHSAGQAYLAMGRYAKADELFKKALDLAEKAGDAAAEAGTLTSMGNMDYALGLSAGSRKKWDKALDLYRKVGYREGYAHVLCRLADNDRGDGEFSNALDKCQKAFAVFAELGAARGRADACYQVSLVYENQGLYQPARAAAEQAMKIFEELGDRSAVASCWHQIGYILARSAEAMQGEEKARTLAEAESWFTRSREEFGRLKQITSAQNSLHELAVIDRELGRLDQGIQRAQECLDYYTKSKDRAGRAAASYNLGLLFEKKQDLAQAAKYLEDSLKAYVEVDSRLGKIRARQALARVHLSQKDAVKAQEELTRAIEDIEKTRGRVAGAFSERAAFLSSHLPAFEQMVALHLDPSRPDAGQAFAFAERSRARAILDLLNLSEAGLWETIQDKKLRDSLQQREEANGQELAKVTYALAELDAKGDVSADERKKQRSDLLDRRQKVLDEARDIIFEAQQASSLYGKRSATDLKPLAAGEVQDMLASGDEVLLAYYVGRDASYAWLIPAEGGEIRWAILKDRGRPVGRDEINRRVGDFLDIAGELVTVTRGERGIGKARKAKAKVPAIASGPLYDVLVPEEFRPALAAAGHIIIVPDAMLRQMPFEALAVGGSPEKPEFWIDKYKATTYAPSATIWRHLRDRQLNRKKHADAVADGEPVTMLALGSPQFSSSPAKASVEVASGDAKGGEFPEIALRSDDLLVPLPGTKVEVETIAALFEGSRQVFVDAGATEEELRKYAPHARYVHIASHGLVDTSKYFLNSRLALTPGGADSGHANDGFLTLREILMEWPGKLPACELAVLSACETCRGHEDLSEGVFALPHGLFFAGVPAVVASLWRVDDKSTAELMAEFYRNLSQGGEGMTKADALHAAKLAVRRKYNEPFYWAPFIFMGEYR